MKQKKITGRNISALGTEILYHCGGGGKYQNSEVKQAHTLTTVDLQKFNTETL